MKTNRSLNFRQLVPVLLFTLMIIGTVSGLETMTTANGDPYTLVIRDPGHPISADEIHQLTTGLNGTTPSVQSARVSAAPVVAKNDEAQKIVAYGFYRDKTGAGHEFEYNVQNPQTDQDFNSTAVTEAANTWVNEIGQVGVGPLAVSQNEDWPVVSTKTRHSEMQPYGKLTLVWELRKKAVSPTGKADFAIRTNSVVEPGVHAWPQSSHWTVDNTQPFLDITHDWSVCPNNPKSQSYAPDHSILGRGSANVSGRLLPEPAFAYWFTKPEITLITFENSTSRQTGTWHMDFYAHSPEKNPEQLILGMMPGSSAEIDYASSGTSIVLADLSLSGQFFNPDSGFSFGFAMEDPIVVT